MRRTGLSTLAGLAVVALAGYAAAPDAQATLMQLTVSGTTDGSWFGFPNTFVTQTTVFDSNAIPDTQVIANVTSAAYPVTSYDLNFGGTTLTPVADWPGVFPSPRIDITNTTPGGPFGNPDQILNGARLNEGFAGYTLKGFLFYSFDYSQVAIDNTALPTSVSYFDQFANARIVQIDVQDAVGGNYGMSLSGLTVQLTEVPEPAGLLLALLGAATAFRRAR